MTQSMQSMQYTVRQANGELVGPLSMDQLKHMVQQGQLRPNDMIAPIGHTFQPLHTYTELAPFVSSTPEPPASMELLSGEIGARELLEGLQPVKILLPNHNFSGQASHAGDLPKVPFPRLYYSLNIHKQTGRLLLIQSEDRTREIYFLRGSPWIIKLPTEEDDLAQLLLDHGLCTFDQLSEGLARLAEQGGELGDHLVALNFLAPSQLYESLQYQFRTRLLSTFQWQEGRYLFFTNERPKESGVPLNLDNLRLIKEGIYEHYGLHQLLWVLEPHFNKSLSAISHRHISRDQLHFSPKEARMYNLIGRVDSVWEFVSQLEQSQVAQQAEALQFLYFLGILDMIQIDDQTLWPPLMDNLRMLQGAPPNG